MDRTIRQKLVNLALKQHKSATKSDRHIEHSCTTTYTLFPHALGHCPGQTICEATDAVSWFMGIMVPHHFGDHSVNLLCCPNSQNLSRRTRDFQTYQRLLPFLNALAHNRPESHWLAGLWAGAFSDLVFQLFLPYPMIPGHWLVSKGEYSQGWGQANRDALQVHQRIKELETRILT